MSLREKIGADLKEAMRNKDEIARDTLRMIKTELDRAALAQLEGGGNDQLSEADEMAVLMRAVKSRKDSAQAYDDGGRPELAEKERAEIQIIERFLPKAMSEDEAKEAVAAIATELGLTEKKQMGQLMKAVMAKHRGVIDGKLASKLAGQILS